MIRVPNGPAAAFECRLIVHKYAAGIKIEHFPLFGRKLAYTITTARELCVPESRGGRPARLAQRSLIVRTLDIKQH